MLNRDENFRVLVVDDDENIRADFVRIFAHCAAPSSAYQAAHAALFGEHEPTSKSRATHFALEVARQGQQGLELVRRAVDEGQPFAMAFVDMRMPPGWDGLRTIEELWRVQDDLQVVLCTAYSDLSLVEVAERLGHPDRLLVLKKPFDPVEVEQMAAALTAKWKLSREERERSAALTRACAAANEAAAAKGQFLANMSHEIRTPLTSMLGFAQALRREEIPRDQALEFLDSIHRNGKHLLQVLSDILDASRLEAGGVRLEKLSFSPIELFSKALADSSGMALEKQLALELECQGTFPLTALGDPTRLQQILLNLIGNAIKFTSSGRVHLRARAAPGSSPRECKLVVDVEDSGPGIPADQIERLFAPFAQVDASMTRRFGGSGLGLAISRHLAQAMHGEIVVASEVGRGSCFTLTVIVELSEGVTWQPAETKLPVPTVPSDCGTDDLRLDARVLLVDDTRDNQLLVSLILRRAGARVEIASDGVEGIDRWVRAEGANAGYDLVVTDMQMPNLDGYQMTRELRQRGCKSPILALTAHALAEDRQRCLDAGCNEYVSKPVDRVQLVNTCAQLLTRRAALPTPTDPSDAIAPALPGQQG